MTCRSASPPLRAKAAALLAALCFVAGATANTGAPAGAKTSKAAASGDRQAELGSLRSRIDGLRGQLAKAEESRSEAADQLREGEVAISDAARRLRELSDARKALSAEIAGLDRQVQSLEQGSAREQRQLERLLHQQHIRGGERSGWDLFLAGKDPNEAARDRYFLSRLALAKADLAKELRGVAEQKRRLRDQVQARETELREVETAAQQAHQRLVKQQQQRATLLASLAGKIRAQRREIGALQRDEQRLAKLVAGIGRIAGQRPAAKGPPRQVGVGGTAKVASADPGARRSAFGQLRGKLSLPVAGSVIGRFGSPRTDGSGGHWKGLLIRAAEGAEVRAVAAGTVVFADWLRGFGNLIILDHGDDFLSIYAFNQALLREVGQAVRTGEGIATAGNSGGLPEPGLYWELRHQGQAFDPQKWTRR